MRQRSAGFSTRRAAAASLVTLLAPLLTLEAASAQVGVEPPLVPDSFVLAPAVVQAIAAEWLTDEERSELRAFHGVADKADLRSPRAAARWALEAWRFDDPALAHDDVPVEWRAECLRRSGELREAIRLTGGTASLAAARIRAEAYEALGDYGAARRAIAPVARRLLRRTITDAAELTEGVRSLAIRARLEGQPARDYQTMISLLARAHQELDRLYWPARLAEARLLLDKHHHREGVAALHETLELNPRCARAWYELGRVALDRFDFASAERARRAVERVDPAHPLAGLLRAETRLVQNDPDGAIEVLDRVLAQRPRLRSALALTAAAHAMRFDQAATRAALARFDEISPGSADAYFTAGRFLAMFRQYDDAADHLEEAIRRRPTWAAPSLELGLMEMQTGRDEKALSVLRRLHELDPFDNRTENSLFLLEEIADYEEIETDHFVIRYREGIDRVFVDLMPERLERMHEAVVARFGWAPHRKTIIEVMPDHKRFAVRVTGMPYIHTIAACTGPIVAMEVPREGPASLHLGTFDWERVLQHEYTHTVTLEQTRYRIPHWLTEAAAVSMEQAPRDDETCMMLARALREGTLFDLDEIKWAFVRPRRPGDRGKAYAQGHWMVEFMDERFGDGALVRLLERYFEGQREEEAIPQALGVSRDEFVRAFLVWAGDEVEAWGFAPRPTMLELTDELREADPELALAMAASRKARLDAIVRTMAERIGAPAVPGEESFTAARWPRLVRPPVEIDDDQLMAWRRRYPDHPELLHEELRRRVEARGRPNEDLIEMLDRLVELRPAGLFAHRQLARILLESDDPGAAIPPLEELDAAEEKSAVYARRLADLYRDAGDLERALAKVMRAVSIDPYRAELRELAAAIAIEAGRLDVARLHVRHLTLLEPDRPRHAKRLARIEELMKQ